MARFSVLARMFLFVSNLNLIPRRVLSLTNTNLRTLSRSSFDYSNSSFLSLGYRSYHQSGVSLYRNKSKPWKVDHRKKKSMEMKSGGSPKKSSKRASAFRADRVLSNRGWGSRSECSDVLKRKRVRVQRKNGMIEILKGPSDRIEMEDPLWVDDKAVPVIPLLLVHHKPKWVLSVMRDGKGRPTVKDNLPSFYQKQDIHHVGRLDYDSSGLLLFSSNGALTEKLLHPKNNITKEYVAVVEGVVNVDELREKLKNGVETSEGEHTADLLEIHHLPLDECQEIWEDLRQTLPAEYDPEDLEMRGYLKSNNDMLLSRVRLTVQEGKHRMVRRMLANCGHGVVLLKRERHGEILLGDLEPGNFRNLTEMELKWATSLIPKTGKKKKGGKNMASKQKAAEL